LGRVERLHWRNARGVPWYGDLIYPVGYQRGTRYPMVVVQYRTRGFLRGGTGDEVPIQTLADQGFLVLSVDNLTYEDIVGRQKTAEERTAAFNRDFAGRKHILSAIESAIEILADRNLVAKDRIGITGLSDGCTTAKFAAINSDKFAAGSVSGCGLEPDQDAVLGPMIAQTYHDSGWPRLIDNAAGIWSQIAFVPQPQRVRFPLLFQAAENEYLAMVGSHTALRQSGMPSDLFVFPDEDHIKSQPAHRLAVYRRNLDWFGFWLKDEIPSDPTRRTEVERWQEMRKYWLGHAGALNAQAGSKEGEDQ
jgi:dienelactone hydrolase